jgi:hypothetical protein
MIVIYNGLVEDQGRKNTFTGVKDGNVWTWARHDENNARPYKTIYLRTGFGAEVT